MTDTKALRNKISEAGFKLSFLAKQLGITPYGFTLKMENKNEFKASEIQVLTDTLKLTIKEKEKIFFAKNVDC